jgi:tellurite resistance protein TehA-like permease
MKAIIFVAIAAIFVFALVLYRLRSLQRFHPKAEMLTGILNQLR